MDCNDLRISEGLLFGNRFLELTLRESRLLGLLDVLVGVVIGWRD